MHGQRGGTNKGTKEGGVTVPLHAHDPLNPHIHHLASALRARAPHSVEILATDGANIDPDDAHTPLSRPRPYLNTCVFRTPHPIEIYAGRGRHHFNLVVKN